MTDYLNAPDGHSNHQLLPHLADLATCDATWMAAWKTGFELDIINDQRKAQRCFDQQRKRSCQEADDEVKVNYFAVQKLHMYQENQLIRKLELLFSRQINLNAVHVA